VKKGSIAMLQEFVQCSRSFPLAPGSSALNWTYESRMVSKSCLEHRAIVAFLLDGIPHLSAGSWQLSKKVAQRDAADRALGLFVGKWGAYLMQLDGQESEDATPTQRDWASELTQGNAMQLLEEFCWTLPECDGCQAPSWSMEYTEHGVFCIVKIQLLGVPHKLAGAVTDSESAACLDVAKRALWYLQCPGFEEAFEQPQSKDAKLEEVPLSPSPPHGWMGDEADADAVEEANRKTMLMRLQNRLQQTYSKQLAAGQSVWEWSFEADPEDQEWPPRFRATVAVPAIHKVFSGDWVRGQKDAQINAVEHVIDFLDVHSGISKKGGA
jgi:hypothetical protein